MRRSVPAFLLAVLLAGCSLSGGDNTTKDSSESLVTVTKLTAAGTTNSVITSGVSAGGNDLADVTFQNTTKSTAITAPSLFFGVTLTRYRVVFSRGDGGPVPAPFEAAMSLFVPPPTTDEKGKVTVKTVSTSIVLVPASAKAASPLKELEKDQRISASATITFEGQDGNGRSLSTTGGIAVLFQP